MYVILCKLITHSSHVSPVDVRTWMCNYVALFYMDITNHLCLRKYMFVKDIQGIFDSCQFVSAIGTCWYLPRLSFFQSYTVKRDRVAVILCFIQELLFIYANQLSPNGIILWFLLLSIYEWHGVSMNELNKVLSNFHSIFLYNQRI